MITCYFKALTVGQTKFLRNNQFKDKLFFEFRNFIAMSKRQTFIHKIKGNSSDKKMKIMKLLHKLFEPIIVCSLLRTYNVFNFSFAHCRPIKCSRSFFLLFGFVYVLFNRIILDGTFNFRNIAKCVK